MAVTSFACLAYLADQSEPFAAEHGKALTEDSVSFWRRKTTASFPKTAIRGFMGKASARWRSRKLMAARSSAR